MRKRFWVSNVVNEPATTAKFFEGTGLKRRLMCICHDPLPVGIFPVAGECRNLQEDEDMAEPHTIR